MEAIDDTEYLESRRFRTRSFSLIKSTIKQEQKHGH